MQRLANSQDTRQELAVERTDLALQRTLLARERTFSAWLRTGLASVAAGLGISRLMGPAASSWITHMVACILILTGGVIYAVALWRYWQGYRGIEREGKRITPMWLMSALVLALLLTTVLALIVAFQPL